MSWFFLRLALRGASNDVLLQDLAAAASYHPVPKGDGGEYEYMIRFEDRGHDVQLMDDLSFTAWDLDSAEVVVAYEGGALESLELKVSYNHKLVLLCILNR